MSKVYSFRLSDDNPREAQARAVIETWVAEGCSLRYVFVEALIRLQQGNADNGEIEGLIEQLQLMLSPVENQYSDEGDNVQLSSSFLAGIKESAKSGVKT